MPDRQDDTSVFEPHAIKDLVEYIDAHLRIAPSLAEMGLRVGLSPSRFARKFRRTTGLSLYGFVTRRRITASLDVLRDPSRPIADLALELGFSSRSHFTRVFSRQTGMTPAKYRRQFSRTTG